MATAVFVYGTLKRGQPRHGLLEGQEFVGPAVTLPRYRLYDCGRYPCLVEEAARGVAVQGEVWRVSDEVLARLDAYEGVPTLYSRRAVALVGVGEVVEAYFYNGDVAAFVDCGGCWPGGTP